MGEMDLILLRLLASNRFGHLLEAYILVPPFVHLQQVKENLMGEKFPVR